MATQRYVILILLIKLKECYEFSPEDYPLHISLVSSFQIKDTSDQLLKKIIQCCTDVNAFTVTAGEDEFFGPNKEVHVTTIVKDDRLQLLHLNLVAVLSKAGAIFDEPDYMLENYRAHATVQQTDRLHTGDLVAINNISIIDKLPNGNSNMRKIVKIIHL